MHCDPTASHYLKQLLDAIFGRHQFRNEIIWHYGKMSNTSSNFPRNHDIILRYTKSDDFCFNPIKGDESEYRNRYLRHLDSNDCVTYGRVKTSTDKLILGRIKKVEKSLGRAINDNDVLFDFNLEFKIQSDVIYVPIIKGNARERTGYPTQKPLALYEKFVTAASNPGDIVLDPFCGCATTPIAAERLDRQWVGIDIWDRAHEVVIDRLRKEGLAAPDTDEDRLVTFGDITYTMEPPVRTDDGETAAPFLQVTERYAEPDGRRMSRAAMVEYLLAQRGSACQGCDRTFDDARYLQLDHNTPRSDGGINHITNRVLLCGPCNQLKSNIYTLSGLRRQNRKHSYMADQR
ncbi:DNA methyltransferase [Candidatus Poriferisodalis sp.]|uniref:DNA methyltransferase n=1 Tax=Candidatus Poriferisodalis sp. TaxID=3101277 RepID=UPI003D11D2B6